MQIIIKSVFYDNLYAKGNQSEGLKNKLIAWFTFGWSRTGTATRTATFIGLSRVMSNIRILSVEPAMEERVGIINLRR